MLFEFFCKIYSFVSQRYVVLQIMITLLSQCLYILHYRNKRVKKYIIVRGVTRLDSARSKTQVWRLHVRN